MLDGYLQLGVKQRLRLQHKHVRVQPKLQVTTPSVDVPEPLQAGCVGGCQYDVMC
jgi:hypothetical protein